MKKIFIKTCLLIFLLLFSIGMEKSQLTFAQEKDSVLQVVDQEKVQIAKVPQKKPPKKDIPQIPKSEVIPTGGSWEYVMETVIPNLTKWFLGIVAAASVIFIIIGGLQLLTAFGNDEKIATAKNTLLWAGLGLLIAIFSYAIVQIINALPLGK